MARLIDADRLIEDIKSEIAEDKELYPDKDWIKYFDSGMRNVIRLVKRLPIQDPVKHGHWIHVDELPSGGYFKCSECNRQIFLNFEWKVSFENPADEYRYCPGCGSRLDGDAND